MTTAVAVLPPFDAEAADDAARQLLLSAQALAQVLAVLDTDRPVVTTDWNGRCRDQFDAEMRTVRAAGQLLAEGLEQTAVMVRARSYEAQAELSVRRARLEGDHPDPTSTRKPGER